MVAQLFVALPNISELLSLGFTRLEMWRANGAENLYEEVTASSATSARLISAEAVNTFRMGGRLLKFVVDEGEEKSVLFGTVVEYWTPQQVADRVNEVSPGVALVSGKSVVLSSLSTGRRSSIVVTYCDASDLGFESGFKVHGKDPRLVLASGTIIYTYTDIAGAPGDHYKWRLSANGVAPMSAFSVVIHGGSGPVDPDLISLAVAKFVGTDGVARKAKIIVVSDFTPVQVGGFLAGTDIPRVFESDDGGFLVAPLLRGLRVRVAIEGTAFVREITVPNAPQFDLLEAVAAAPDPFTIQVPPPFLYRRSI